jgi:hypothetical protein
MNADIIAAGFLLVKPVPRPEWLSKELLPEQIVSASACICPQFPNSYAIRWSSDSDESREKQFDVIGLAPARRGDAMAWATEKFEEAFGWPGVFFTLEAARDALARFLPGSDLMVIGVGLPRQYRAAFISHATPPPPQPGFAPMGKSGYLLAIEASGPMPPSPDILGYEPLNLESGQIDHSWLCNHLEEQVAHSLGIRPGATGLIESLAEASRCCEFIESPEVGAEPGPWVPWQLTRYDAR